MKLYNNNNNNNNNNDNNNKELVECCIHSCSTAFKKECKKRILDKHKKYIKNTNNCRAIDIAVINIIKLRKMLLPKSNRKQVSLERVLKTIHGSGVLDSICKLYCDWGGGGVYVQVVFESA